jgi:pimeloyl-ACP methyl ester carboxylesterase
MGARLAAVLMWLLDPLLRPADPSDMLAFARAEDEFDLRDRLANITTPTLVIAGDRDAIYPADVIRGTASGLHNGTLILYPGTGHAGAITKGRFTSDVTSFLQSGDS